MQHSPGITIKCRFTAVVTFLIQVRPARGDQCDMRAISLLKRGKKSFQAKGAFK